MSKKSLTAEQKEQARSVFARVPFVQLLGMELLDVDYGTAAIKMKIRDKLRQPYGLLHGGATASLTDTATAFAVAAILGEAETASTVDLTIHYLRPVTDGEITATARVIKAGKRLLTVTADVTDENGNHIATCLCTYSKV
jgi:uncharacterized protein (TIGR00369 family)